MSVVENKKLSLQAFHFREKDVVWSYAQRNEVYRILIFCLLQYGISKWLVDIQNPITLTGEKLKKKICSLKLTRPLDEFVIFDTRPILDLTTANVDPWLIFPNLEEKHLKSAFSRSSSFSGHLPF